MKTSNRDALKAYDLKRSVFTSHSILRSPDAETVIYVNDFTRVGHFWFVNGTVTQNGSETPNVMMRLTEVEKAIESGALIVSVKDMSCPCPTDEPAHPDAGKMVIN